MLDDLKDRYRREPNNVLKPKSEVSSELLDPIKFVVELEDALFTNSIPIVNALHISVFKEGLFVRSPSQDLQAIPSVMNAHCLQSIISSF